MTSVGQKKFNVLEKAEKVSQIWRCLSFSHRRYAPKSWLCMQAMFLKRAQSVMFREAHTAARAYRSSIVAA